jgi:AcrR family transcriptional regulator
MNETNVRTNMRPAGQDTRERILDAAEHLFAEHGYDGASLRDITAKAGVNLAAVNYHFRTKESLIQAVFARRLAPLNQRRLALLDACEASAGGRPLELEEVVRALISPVLRLGHENPEVSASLKKLMGRIFMDPGSHLHVVLREQFRDLVPRFVSAFRRALPSLPQEELFWRMHFSIGAMACTLTGTPFLKIISNGRYDASDMDAAGDRLVTFICGGMRATLPSGEESGKKAVPRHRPKARGRKTRNHRERSREIGG